MLKYHPLTILWEYMAIANSGRRQTHQRHLEIHVDRQPLRHRNKTSCEVKGTSAGTSVDI